MSKVEGGTEAQSWNYSNSNSSSSSNRSNLIPSKAPNKALDLLFAVFSFSPCLSRLVFLLPCWAVAWAGRRTAVARNIQLYSCTAETAIIRAALCLLRQAADGPLWVGRLTRKWYLSIFWRRIGVSLSLSCLVLSCLLTSPSLHFTSQRISNICNSLDIRRVLHG